MGYFPMCMEIREKNVVFVGNGRQIREKAEKLQPFGARQVFLTNPEAKTLAELSPVFVIVGDTGLQEAERISLLCRDLKIPVNVVDVPALCTFCFPALLVRGEMTVSVSSGGKSPAASACVRERLETVLPEKTEEILDWLSEYRADLRARGILKEAVAKAFALGRPLTKEETDEITVTA